MDWKKLCNEIIKHDVIAVFRHENPDCDAVGSQFGLVNWLRENFPDKRICAVGNDKCYQAEWPSSDSVDDATVKRSLAIILDTANTPRVDDQRFLTAEETIKIDHHPEVDKFGDQMYVNVKAAATCEILADFFRSCSQYKMSEKTADFLYRGLLTDTLNYSTSNTTAETLQAGAYLAGFGIDIPAIGRELFDKTEAEFRFSGYIRTHVKKAGEQLAYCTVSEQMMNEYAMTPSRTRSFVEELGHVNIYQVWCIFTEKHMDGKLLYDGSLRSKTSSINAIAEKYNGGGHKNACGVKNLTENDLIDILKLLQTAAE